MFPKLFIYSTGVFITKGDVGVGTIVGSAVFNILFVIGLCGILAGEVYIIHESVRFHLFAFLLWSVLLSYIRYDVCILI